MHTGTSRKSPQPRFPPCSRCSRSGHPPPQCRFRQATCHKCGKSGHIAPACRSKTSSSPDKGLNHFQKGSRSAHTVTVDSNDGSQDEKHLFRVWRRSSRVAPIKCSVLVEGHSLIMEVDTGADVSLISDATRQSFCSNLPLTPTDIKLRTYTNEAMDVLGELHVHVQYQGQTYQLSLLVVAGDGPSLLGRNWLKFIRLNWHEIHSIQSADPQLNVLLSQHANLFQDGLGTIFAHKAELSVKEDAPPNFCKAQPVPFAVRDAVGAQLDHLEAEGVLQKVPHSLWAAPIVVVPKKDGTYRLCGDYKVTVNQVLDVDQYPLPKPEEIFASLAGGQKFSKLDLSKAYQQLLLSDESKEYTTINTHQGLYQYTRLPFGISSAPAVFQRTMDTILQGIPHVACYIDDILVTGKDDDEHLQSLQKVFQALEVNGLRLQRSKCKFLQPSLEYLGFWIDAQGLHPLASKVEAIEQALKPTNPQQLKSFLGLLTYYGKFIPNLSTLVHPLNQLLHTDAKWTWSEACETAFTAAKQTITSSNVLAHYDPHLPLTLAADAPAYGIGAVISHTFPDGSERPIAFASRTLTNSEKNYAQIEKEALSLIFGIKKFNTYLYGRKFTLVTDHKPLTSILGPKKGVPTLAAARLQRWAMFLSAYSYDIQYKNTLAHGNVDGLSRLPLPYSPQDGLAPEATLFNLSQVDSLPVTHSDVEEATQTDDFLQKVHEYTRNHWPDEVPKDLLPYHRRRFDLTVEGQYLLWGSRVIIPESLRGSILQELHSTHSCMTQMKRIPRSYFWWPSLDQHIEDLIKGCIHCQSNRDLPASVPLNPWVWPAKPWQRIQIDFAGPFLGRMFLIVVGAHSKWPEVFNMNQTTSSHTIQVLRHLFSHYDLPRQLVSDNGPQFVSAEFQQFMQMNGIKHLRSAPYHPATNGQAERFVKTFKYAMKAGQHQDLPLAHRISNFLLRYRTTPHTTTNRTPSYLFLQREMRTRFDLLRPDCEDTVLTQQFRQKKYRDSHAKQRVLKLVSP